MQRREEIERDRAKPWVVHSRIPGDPDNTYHTEAKCEIAKDIKDRGIDESVPGSRIRSDGRLIVSDRVSNPPRRPLVLLKCSKCQLIGGFGNMVIIRRPG